MKKNDMFVDVVGEEKEVTKVEESTSFDYAVNRLKSDIEAAEKERKDSVISSKRGRLIRLIKEEIKKIKSMEELSTEDQESLDNLQKMLETELGNHKDHLKLTYKEDFLAERATVPAIFTVLPKGVGIQFKRVLNCIDELKEAKTNKEKIFGVVDVGKQIGLLAATPVIFTAKFIARHWYLLLLLLSLLAAMNFDWLKDLFGKLPFFAKKGEDDDNEKDNSDGGLKEEATDPVTQTNPEFGLEPKPVIPGIPVPGEDEEEHTLPNPKPEPQPKPGFVPGYAFEENEETDPVITPSPEVVPEVVLTPEQNELAKNISETFIDKLEQQFSFFIAERHPDTVIVHSAQEYYDAVKELTGGRTPFEVSGAEDYYKYFNVSTEPSEQSIVWPEMEEFSNRCFETNQDLINYVASGEDPDLTEFANDFIEDMDKSSVGFDMSAVESICDELGISVGAGITIFALYELIQYGLAIPTGGASLVMPG